MAPTRAITIEHTNGMGGRTVAKASLERLYAGYPGAGRSLRPIFARLRRIDAPNQVESIDQQKTDGHAPAQGWRLKILATIFQPSDVS